MIEDNESIRKLENKGYTCFQCGKPLKFILRETHPEGLIFNGNCGNQTHDVSDYFVPTGKIRRTKEEQIKNLNRLSQNELKDRARYAIESGLVEGKLDRESRFRDQIVKRIKKGENWSPVLW
jgi:hypothetical protein